MRKSTFTESQIVQTIKGVGGDRPIKVACRELGISEATCCHWKSKYGGMEAVDVRRLRELEDENAKLKRMYADLAFKVNALKDVIALLAELAERHPDRGFGRSFDLVRRRGKRWNHKRVHCVYREMGLDRRTGHVRPPQAERGKGADRHLATRLQRGDPPQVARHAHARQVPTENAPEPPGNGGP